MYALITSTQLLYTEILIFCISLSALAMGLCISMIAYIRLPSLKVSTLLLMGLLVYDVFWVSKLVFIAETIINDHCTP